MQLGPVAVKLRLGAMNFGCEEYLIPSKPAPSPLSTGSEHIDKLLGGGVLTGELTEVFGCQGSGKTQFALSLCGRASNVCNVLLIDTEGGVSYERLRELNVNEDAVHFVRMPNADRVLACLPHVLPRMLEDIGNVRLVVVDSVIFLSRSTTMEHPIQRCVAFAARMGYLANKHGCAVLLVNDAKDSTDFDDAAPVAPGEEVKEELKEEVEELEVESREKTDEKVDEKANEEANAEPVAAMGELWGEMCSTRLALDCDHNGKRTATLVKSERCRLGCTEFTLGKTGIGDPD